MADAPTPAPSPDLTRPPTGAPGGPPIPPTVPLTVEEYQRLRGLEHQLAEFHRSQAAAADAAEATRLKLVADKEGAEKALDQQRTAWEAKHAESVTRYNQLEQGIFHERRDAVLGAALQGRDFVGSTPEQKAAAAGHVRRLLADDFETRRDASGSLVVLQKVSGRPAAEVLREVLDSPEYALYFVPSSRGGSGADGTRSPAAPPTTNQFAAQVMADYAAKHGGGQYPSIGLGPLQR